MAERSDRLLADDNVERATFQLVQVHYELQYVGPNCERHWLTAVKHMAIADERLVTALECLRRAMEPFGPELMAEHAKIVTRRH